VHLFSLTSSSKSEGNAIIYAVYIGNLNTISTDTVILYCHGNRDHMDFYWNRAKLLAHIGGKHQYGVLMFDYRGYGKSSGKPTEKGMYADVDACLNWLAEKGISSSRLHIYGYSLGSAVATEVMHGNYILKPSKLILEAPFASTDVMVHDASGLALPRSYFTNNKVNNADKIKSVTAPFCWIHGTADDFLSIHTHGEVVYANYNGSKKEAHRIKGGVHNNVPEVWGYESYVTAMYRFLSN
jgi:pimeloyl-ACP methyl ester carboxylesterase